MEVNLHAILTSVLYADGWSISRPGGRKLRPDSPVVQSVTQVSGPRINNNGLKSLVSAPHHNKRVCSQVSQVNVGITTFKCSSRPPPNPQPPTSALVMQVSQHQLRDLAVLPVALSWFRLRICSTVLWLGHVGIGLFWCGMWQHCIRLS